MFRLPDGSLMEITKVYPLDAVFDNLDDVPEDVSNEIRSFFPGEAKEIRAFYYIFFNFILYVGADKIKQALCRIQ